MGVVGRKGAIGNGLRIVLTDDTITIGNTNTTIGYARYAGSARKIEYIFVHPAFRRMGYGRFMVDALEDHVGSYLWPEPPISPLGQFLFLEQK
jgi:GNAT superfamily N-acetyltransferase